jgi:outer membrane protein assembly factor BamB
LLLLVILCNGCKKQSDPKTSPPTSGQVKPPSLSFKLTKLKKYNNNFIDITWSKPSADTSLRYSLVVNGVPVISQLKDTIYFLQNILATLSYQAKIIATNSKGDTAVANFAIDAEKEFIYSNLSDNNFGCYTTKGLFVWQRNIGVTSFTAISNDTLFVRGKSEATSVKAIYALDVKTGKIQWSVNDPLVETDRDVQILYDQGVAYLIGESKIYALNASNGQIMWSKDRLRAVDWPLAKNGLLFCLDREPLSYVPYIGVYDSKNGVQKWKFRTPNMILGLPAESDGTTYVLNSYPTENWSAGNVADLNAIDTRTGEKKWVYSFRGMVGYSGILSRPLVVGNTVFVSVLTETRGENSLYAVDKNSGKLLWRTAAADDGYLLADDTGLYLNFLNGGVAKFNLKTGAMLWSKNTLQFVILTQKFLYSHALDQYYDRWSTVTSFKANDTATGEDVPIGSTDLKAVNGFIMMIDGVVYSSRARFDY